MKKTILILIVLILTISKSYGQACGKYKIQYVGKVTGDKQIKAIYLPTPDFLDKYVNFNDENALLKTSTSNHQFNGNVISSLGRVYHDEQQILSAYQSKHSTFKMKIDLLDNNILKETIIEIDWKNIQITKQKEGNMSTFLFDLKTINL